jgi:hypothetical protein
MARTTSGLKILRYGLCIGIPLAPRITPALASSVWSYAISLIHSFHSFLHGSTRILEEAQSTYKNIYV